MDSGKHWQMRKSTVVVAALLIGASLSLLSVAVPSAAFLSPASLKQGASLLWSQEAAGWAQAIGTFVALLVAVGVPLYLHQRERWEAERYRIQETADLARSLHFELAEHVARCCFDFESPWSSMENSTRSPAMPSFRVRKFLPAEPTIFPQVGDKIAMLPGNAPAALLRFYYRTASLKRDLENVANLVDAENGAGTGSQDNHLLASRFRHTLRPGLLALEAVGALVPDALEIENDAIAAHDQVAGNDRHPDVRSLRKRLIEALE